LEFQADINSTESSAQLNVIQIRKRSKTIEKNRANKANPIQRKRKRHGVCYLSRNSGTNSEKESTKIPSDCSRKKGERIVCATIGNLSQECKEKHVNN
jgi:hypothetical protein